MIKKITLTILVLGIIIGGVFIGYNYSAKANIYGSDLVGWWTLDFTRYGTGAGGVLDSSGNANNGTQVNTPAQLSCQVQQCLQFDGTDYVNLGNPASLQGTGSHTYAGWVKLDVLPTEDSDTTKFLGTKGSSLAGLFAGAIATGGSNEWAGCVVTTNPSTVQYCAVTTGGTATKNWHHVATVYDSSVPSVSVYINGVFNDSETTGTVLRHGGDSYIGTSPDIDRYMKGSIDDVRLYNRALSAGEVAELYYNGVSYFNNSF